MVDLTASRIGRWYVMSAAGAGRWFCQCECGTTRTVAERDLRSGHSRSCGCSRRKPQGARSSVERRKDLLGMSFGKLHVVMFGLITPGRSAYWLCQCQCGRFKLIAASSLTLGRTTSCGCVSHNGWKNNHRPRKKSHPLYPTWTAMRQRCCNVNVRAFRNYGARGIKVCDRWSMDFWAFVADMGNRPMGYSIERIDNDGNYEPTNCVWADRITQNRNRRNTHY